jgi:hypothetical protein
LMDIYGLEGNIAFARVLFARNGTHIGIARAPAGHARTEADPTKT